MLNFERKSQIIFVIIFVLLFDMLVFVVFLKFQQSRFGIGTNIQSVSCSCLTVDGAQKKISNQISNSEITFKFCDENEYNACGEQFDIQIKDVKDLERIFANQKNESTLIERKQYNLTNAFTINTEKLQQYLAQIPELKKENMVEPKNASINFEKKEKIFKISQETDGTVIDFEEAVNFAEQKIENGENIIDFTEITQIKPRILCEDINSGVEDINSILKTTINFKLKDGSVYSLDANVMKKWLSKNKNGSYVFEVDNNITKFVKELNQKTFNIRTANTFKNSSGKNITINIGNEIDTKKQISYIKSKIKTGETYECTPIYKDFSANLKDYVKLDISKQTVWLYKNKKCILTTSCVTGDVSGNHNTPTGVYYLTYKTMNVSLTGYNNDGSKYDSKVTYWMPFNGDIGFHDASWRSYFGGTIYKYNGSHGCVNLPYSSAQRLYQNINYSMPIIIY